MWVIVIVVAAVVLVATYLTWVAARVDRLHARAAAAHSALDAQSVRRAAAAADLGERCGLGDVQLAARAVLDSEPDEVLENDLTRVLRSGVGSLPADDSIAVAGASRRLALARQVHTDLVRDARAVRRHPAVRMFRFARRHPEPSFFDIDDPSL
jgi:hypothetical protein